MADYTANLSNPQSVTGSTPVHESVAASIGAALGGAAKLLDVGLKASAADRLERLDVEIGDRLQPISTSLSGQGNAFDQTHPQPWEGAPQLNKLTKYAQANAHSPDRVSSTMLMGQAASITQDLIHQHPRFADEIRMRVQKILGVNPNEELIKQQLHDEQAIKDATLQVKVRGAEEATAAGYPMTMNPDGTPNWESGYVNYMVHKRSEADAADLHQRLENEHLQHPAETKEARDSRVSSDIMRLTDPAFNQISQTYVSSLLQTMSTRGSFIARTDTAGGPLSADRVIELRTQAIQGTAAAKLAVTRVVNNLREKAMAEGNQTTTEDWDKVLKTYNEQFAAMENLFVKAPNDEIEARVKGLQGLQAQIKMHFLEANHTIAVLQAFLGENNPTLGSMFGDALTRNPAAGLAMDKAANTAIGGVVLPETNTPNTPQPIPPSPGPIGDAHRLLGRVTDLASGTTQTITDRQLAYVTEGQLRYYGSNTDRLTPTEVTKYGTLSAAVANTGLNYVDTGQIGGALNAVATPAMLRTFSKFEKEHPDQAQPLGQSVVKLGQHYINQVLNTQALAPTTGGTRLTYTPVYNPSAGKMEIRVTDPSGHVVANDVRYAATPQFNGLPAAMSQQVNLVNQALNAAAQLKQYGDHPDWQDAQIKQELATGFTLKPGSTPVENPEQKAAAKPSERQVNQEQAPNPTGEAHISPAVMHAVESNNRDRAVSGAGAKGIAQVTDKAAASPGFGIEPAKDNSPEERQRVGDQMWDKYQELLGHPALAAIAYNRGAGNYNNWLNKGAKYEDLPTETKDYLGRLQAETHHIDWRHMPATEAKKVVTALGRTWFNTIHNFKFLTSTANAE